MNLPDIGPIIVFRKCPRISISVVLGLILLGPLFWHFTDTPALNTKTHIENTQWEFWGERVPVDIEWQFLSSKPDKNTITGKCKLVIKNETRVTLKISNIYLTFLDAKNSEVDTLSLARKIHKKGSFPIQVIVLY